MAILGSIRRARVECFSYQCKRWYSHIYGINFMNDAVGGRRVQILVHGRTSEQFSATRSFAAPVQAQAKPKVEAKHTGGPRLNKAITSEFVRLVTDEGHSVVSRREALNRAMRLKLDLVEVHRNAKPPVCKIMDFHKEMYKQQLKEKDRLKGKSALTLRKSDCKEVRFTGKTEQKDLQMKADMVKRQMDRGYRVKCMAMGTEEEDLGGLLSRLFALIEDVAFVESGPRVEKRQAYVVVRHSKFGSTKKSPAKKVAKIAPSSEVKAAATSPPMFTSTDPAQIPLQVEEEWEHTESVSEMEETLSDEEADALDSSGTPITTPIEEPEEASGEKMEWSAVDASDDFEKVFGFDGDSSGTTSRSTVNHSLGSVDAVSLKEDIADIAELLPKKLPITSVVRGPDLSSADQRGQINESGIVKNDLREPKIHSLNPRWQPRPAVNAAPSTTQNPKSADNSSLRNLKPPSLNESRIHSPNPRWQPQPAVNAAPSTTQNPKSADNSLLRDLMPPSLDESRIHSPNPRWQPQPAPNPRWQPQPAVNATPSTTQNPKSADNSSLRNLKPPSLDESRVHSPNPRWQPQPAVNATPSTAQNPKSADNSSLRNLKPPSLDESKKQPQVDTKQGPSVSSYGIFSAPKTAAPSFQKTSTEGNSSKERNTVDPVKSPGSISVSSNANPLKPAAESPRQDADKTKQRGWGIFSAETSGPNQHRNPDSQMKDKR